MRPYGLHASFLPLVGLPLAVPLPVKLKRKNGEYKIYPSSGSIERTHKSRDPEGCTYQSSDPEGYMYQSSDSEGYTYRSSDPEGCTYQSSDPEGYTYQRAISNQAFRETRELERQLPNTFKERKGGSSQVCSVNRFESGRRRTGTDDDWVYAAGRWLGMRS
ncbi:NBS-LRR type resistance protein [Cucumis melo var. makuwa]|uniref:NBS-LRR type resistance protein n=1 Tax=Cucumis melo var. makuwa TaxID=1194695 RepID=A0A5A7V136_CUCMM|nr:NBS-LRR type resistance protein [Cucumis melo var. makuwa]